MKNLTVLVLLALASCGAAPVYEKVDPNEAYMYDGRTTNVVISRTDLKSEDPAKMTHSISDFLSRP